MAGLSDISCPDTSLGAGDTETCTATYTTTQGDVDHGSITNTGTATGTAPNGKKVTAKSSVCIPLCQKPAIELKKSANVDSFSAPGTLITYSYKVTNTGNVTLDPVVVSDPMAGLSDISCPDTSLGAGDTETCTATYTTTQGDVDHGSITNTGTATGTAPNGKKVTAKSSVCIPLCQKPAIELKKSASIDSFSAPGTLITYSYKVTNTGNVTLDPVVVSDPMAGLSDLSCPDTSLGPQDTETCTATYTTTQGDVDHGSLCNTGTATGTPPKGDQVTDKSSLCIPAEQNPSISVVKTASIDSFSAPGTLVTYSYKVTNTGNVTLDPVVVSDPMAGLSDLSCPDTSLGPQDSETCTATYTTTQGDVDHGSLCNTGTATGTPPKGDQVTDMSSLCIPAEQNPSISVVKTASIDSFSAPGTLVTYSYKVTNTGNVTLDPVVVSDPMAGLSDISCPDTSLGPQELRDLHRHLHDDPGRRGPRLAVQHRHRHGHPAQGRPGDGHVLAVHPGRAEPVHLGGQDGQHRLLLGPGHARHLLLQGDQHRQRHAGPGRGERPHGRPLGHLVPRHLAGPPRTPRPAPPPTRRPRATWTTARCATPAPPRAPRPRATR